MTLLALLVTLAVAAEPSPEAPAPIALPAHRWPPVAPADHALTEVAFGTGFGFMPLNLGGLNDALAAAGHPRVGTFQITSLSVNAELWIGRMVPGFDSIGWSNVGAEKAGDSDTTITFAMSELSYGYGVVYKPLFDFEPRLGFALADTNIVINHTGPVNADLAMDTADRALNLHRQDMLTDLGLGFGWMIPLTKVDVDGVGTGLRVAFRAGGLIQLFHTSGWKSDGEKVEDMPGMYLGGPYLRLFVSPSLLVRYPKVHHVKPSKAHPAVDQMVEPTAPEAQVAPVEVAPTAAPVEVAPVAASVDAPTAEPTPTP